MTKRERPSTEAATDRWLRERFTLPSLREGQAGVVLSLLNGKRVLFVAPTGHGKSLCYQALAASPWSKGLVLVFQPLKALMNEQAQKARDLGVRAQCIHSDLETTDGQAILAQAVAGQLDLLFLAPERQGNPDWIEAVGQMKIKGVVVDEAHCISQWGHDFRPWYRRLVGTVMGLGLRTPVLAVTATAPAKVVRDVEEQIGSADTPIESLRLPSFRANLACAALEVSGLSSRLAMLLAYARTRAREPGIAYTLTKDEADVAASFLKANGVPAVAYHSEKEPEDKEAALADWRSARARVICATQALGMGIDRADVRWVMHLGMPDSLIRYVQEIGRIGRDRKPAQAVLLDDPETADIQEWFCNSTWPPAQDYTAAADALRSGSTTRTDAVARTDVPEGSMQRILDDFVQGKLASRRRSTKSYQYAWIGGNRSPVPPGAAEAQEIRRAFLADAKGYVAREGCRSRNLARAMGDKPLPDPCRACDLCVAWSMPDARADLGRASDFLANFTPPLKGDKRVGLKPGRALARYGVGRVGEAVQATKNAKQPAPDFVIDRAVEIVTTSDGPYAGVRFTKLAAVPSSSGRTYVTVFAGKLASLLRLDLLPLEFTRQVQPQKKFRSAYWKSRNVRDAIAAAGPVLPEDVVLVVDDVWDSGSTMKEAARILQPATVYPLVLARTRHSDG